MDGLMRNDTFRLRKPRRPTTSYIPGIYRVILRNGLRLVAALIESEEAPQMMGALWVKSRDQDRCHLKSVVRPPPETPIVVQLFWFDAQALKELHEMQLLQPLNDADSKAFGQKSSLPAAVTFAARKSFMAAFLDEERVRTELLESGNLNRLFEEAIATHGIKRSTVLSLWSMLCRRGFDASSLHPRRSACSL